MVDKKLEPSEWKDYFDDFSKRLPVALVEIEVASLALGDQLLSEWAPLNGISYDPGKELLLISLGDEGTDHLDHFIHAPREIYVNEGDRGINSIGIVDSEGDTQIIRFRKSLRLPAEGRPTERVLEPH